MFQHIYPIAVDSVEPLREGNYLKVLI